MSNDRSLNDLFHRQLPSSSPAEQTILGAIMIAPDLMGQAAEALEPGDFYSPEHRRVFAAMTELFRASKTIDAVTVAEEMRKSGPIDAIGGVAGISNLTNGVPAFTDISDYVRIVKSAKTRRRLIHACQDIQADAMARETDVDEILDRAEQAIFDLNSTSGPDTKMHMLAELVGKQLELKQEQIASGVRMDGFMTGIAGLDQKTGGFRPGDLVIVGGRPSMGKTALVTQALFHGTTTGRVGIFFSCEMATPQVIARVVCQQADINLWGYNQNHISDHSWARIREAYPPFEGKNLYIDDTPSITPMQILARGRRLKAKHKRLDVIVVDYLQLMGSNTRSDSRQQEVSRISRDLKAVAKTLGVPVIALSQLSRAPEGRADNRPLMSDLRESGSIEQDADTVLLVFRAEYYEKTAANSGLGEIIIGKQRNGPTGSVKVAWCKESAIFRDLITEA